MFTINICLHVSIFIFIYKHYFTNMYNDDNTETNIVAIFCPFGLFCEVDVSLPSL